MLVQVFTGWWPILLAILTVAAIPRLLQFFRDIVR